MLLTKHSIRRLSIQSNYASVECVRISKFNLIQNHLKVICGW